MRKIVAEPVRLPRRRRRAARPVALPVLQRRDGQRRRRAHGPAADTAARPEAVRGVRRLLAAASRATCVGRGHERRQEGRRLEHARAGAWQQHDDRQRQRERRTGEHSRRPRQGSRDHRRRARWSGRSCASGLLDELRLFVHPIVLGSSKKLFDGDTGKVRGGWAKRRRCGRRVLSLVYASEKLPRSGTNRRTQPRRQQHHDDHHDDLETAGVVACFTLSLAALAPPVRSAAIGARSRIGKLPSRLYLGRRLRPMSSSQTRRANTSTAMARRPAGPPS